MSAAASNRSNRPDSRPGAAAAAAAGRLPSRGCVGCHSWEVLYQPLRGTLTEGACCWSCANNTDDIGESIHILELHKHLLADVMLPLP
jgi:hypothetical protein